MSLPDTLVCASRASALALAQTRMVAAKLATTGIATTILTVTTTGDRVQDRPLTALGANSIFVSELETALRDGRAQYAVHSCKDLPSALADDMRLAAISTREDSRDAFCSERYDCYANLPPGARVGTSSPRRRSQLQRLRPDLTYDDLRGNVDTRLRKLREGQYDAIVIAVAGMHRLHTAAAYVVPFEIDEIVPAVGQGALAVEVSAALDEVADRLRVAVNDVQAEIAVACERAALRALRGGCAAPIGIHARFADGMLVADAAIGNGDGFVVRERASTSAGTIREAERLGTLLAKQAIASRAGQRYTGAAPK